MGACSGAEGGAGRGGRAALASLRARARCCPAGLGDCCIKSCDAWAPVQAPRAALDAAARASLRCPSGRSPGSPRPRRTACQGCVSASKRACSGAKGGAGRSGRAALVSLRAREVLSCRAGGLLCQEL